MADPRSAAQPVPRSGPGSVRLFLLDGGMLEVDRAVIHPGDDSRRKVTLPVPLYLIESDGQRLLVDTGVPLAAVGDPDGLRREYGTDPDWIKPLVSSPNRIDAQLRLLGLTLADLDLVVCTHFHFDHAGGNELFAGVLPVTVQEAELIAAQESDDYMPVWDAPDLQFHPIEGDWSPLPGVEFVFTPGHTPGHQSVLVRLRDRPWLLTIDAVYTEEHWRGDKVGAVHDVPTARASLDRLRRIAREEDAHLVFGHDLAQWESLKKAPEGYE